MFGERGEVPSEAAEEFEAMQQEGGSEAKEANADPLLQAEFDQFNSAMEEVRQRVEDGDIENKGELSKYAARGLETRQMAVELAFRVADKIPGLNRIVRNERKHNDRYKAALRDFHSGKVRIIQGPFTY